MKYILILLFIVRVTIPMGAKATYQNVREIWCPDNATHYVLKLEDGSKVYVPVMFTIIEEIK